MMFEIGDPKFYPEIPPLGLTRPPVLLCCRLEPPYTNRWGTVPGPDYIRCKGTTRQGKQCRRCAVRGKDYCDAHGERK